MVFQQIVLLYNLVTCKLTRKNVAPGLEKVENL
jgi:hypothetical protein